MAKIVGGKFTLLWTPSTEPDVAGYQVFFGPTDQIDYDSPSVFVEEKDQDRFDSPEDLPEGFELPFDAENEVIFARIGAVDNAGNISDLSPAVEIPFDATPPGPVTDFRLG